MPFFPSRPPAHSPHPTTIANSSSSALEARLPSSMLESLLPNEYLRIFHHLPDVQAVTNGLVSLAPLYTYGTASWGIYRRRSSAGFSIDICATMLMASILRILYYFSSPYEVSLLRQSFVMVFIQCVLLHVALRFRPSSYDPALLCELPDLSEKLASIPAVSASSYHYDSPQLYSLMLETALQYVKVYSEQTVRFFDVYYQRPFHFWQWAEDFHYWKFLQYFSLSFAVLTLLLHQSATYASFIGTLGLFIEALLPLPQILMLQRLQTVRDFKSILLISWLGGDLMKLAYLVYGTTNVSFIFVFAALFQMSLDLVVLSQYIHFSFLDSKMGPQPVPLQDLNPV